MVVFGSSLGTSVNGDMAKSLDDIISDRRKEQAKASSGRNVKDGKNKTSNAKDKKNAVVDRSIGTGRAKRAATARARRGLSNDGAAKPTAMEVEKEVYRQARKTSTTKKKVEKKASNGRLPPNSSLREKRNTRSSNNNSRDESANDPPGVPIGRIPRQIQIKAAIQGMYDAGCPVPQGFQLVMQFSPKAVQEKGKKPNKNSNNNRNNNNNNRNGNNNNNNQRNGNGNNNNNSGRRRSGQGQRNWVVLEPRWSNTFLNVHLKILYDVLIDCFDLFLSFLDFWDELFWKSFRS